MSLGKKKELGHEIKTEKENQTRDVHGRIGLIKTAFSVC